MYPYFNSIQFGLCRSSASAEFKLSPKLSILPSVNLYSNSLATGLRMYFTGKETSGFISGRISSRNRLGFGIGISTNHTTESIFGVSYDWITNECKPFISFEIILV